MEVDFLWSHELDRDRYWQGALAGNRLVVSAYQFAVVAGRNRKNYLRPTSPLRPVVTRRCLYQLVIEVLVAKDEVIQLDHGWQINEPCVLFLGTSGVPKSYKTRTKSGKTQTKQLPWRRRPWRRSSGVAIELKGQGLTCFRWSFDYDAVLFLHHGRASREPRRRVSTKGQANCSSRRR
jgi:hypothetical protein